MLRDEKPYDKETFTDEDIFIKDLDDIQKKISKKNINAIIHLATDYGIKDKKYVDLCNYELPVQLLEIAKQNSIKYFINADSFFSDLPDSYPHLKEYRKSKKRFRSYGKEFALKNNLNFYNMRIFHMFGPEDSHGKFVHDMKNSLEDNLASINLTDCTQLRDFIYIDDVVSAFANVINNKHKIKELYANFDVGRGEKVTIRYFLETLKEQLKSKSYLNFGALDKRRGEEDLELINADNHSLRKLGWNTSKKLEDDIATLIK